MPTDPIARRRRTLPRLTGSALLGLLACLPVSGRADDSAPPATQPPAAQPTVPTVPPLPPVPPVPPRVTLPPTARQQATLDLWQSWRQTINLPTYGTSWSGTGVLVGMVDTGLDTRHPVLAGQVGIGYNAMTGTQNVQDENGHGTHVAGIIAGRLVDNGVAAGVAPDAYLAVAKVFGAGGTTTQALVDQGIRWLVDVAHAPIINLSLGNSQRIDPTMIRYATASGALIVAAAGNDGLANPGWPARFANQSWASGRIIVVGALNADGEIASFSNRAGDTRNNFVVAPGTTILSTFPGGDYAWMSGTSMATPMVTGQAATIKGAWPYLQAEQVAQIIFRTARDLGAPGVDPVYGWGLIDVARSLAPVGSLSVPTLTGQRVALDGPTSVASTAPATMGASGGASRVRTQAFDDFGRNFTVAPGAALARSTPLSLESVLGPADRLLAATSFELARGLRMTSVTDAPRLTQLSAGQDPYGPQVTTMRAMSASLTEETPAGQRSLQMGTGSLGYQAFGMPASTLGMQLAGAEQSLASPLLRFAGNHRFVSMTNPLAAGWAVRTGAVTSDTPVAASQGSIGLFELVHQGPSHAVTVGYSNLNQPSVLGAVQPMMGFAQASHTQALSLSAAQLVAPDVALAGVVHLARTDPLAATGGDTMFAGSTSTRASGFGMAAVFSNLATQDDRVSLSLSSPLRADNGVLRYNVVNAVDPATGAPSLASQSVDARPDGREKLLELRYSRRLTRASSLALSLAGRFQPDHDAQARTQSLAAVRYLASF